MNTGKVKFFNVSKGYGFIIEDCNEAEHFVHSTGLIDQINEGLERQAKAFCIFVDKNLVHITWLALNNESKKFVDDWPMKIDWSNTGVWGLAYTHPNFRKNGFYQYTHKQIQKFLLSKNIKFNRFTIKKRNIPSISAMSKFKPKNIAKGYSFHLLKFKFRLSIPINIK